MEFDVVMLSRIQFALTVMFHYLYPPLSIGLGLCIVIMEGLFLKTGNKMYEEMTKFWVRVFGLTFGLGVATGLVMEFEFGTNWATYSRYVGDVFGSALAAEGIFAFFLESGFLAVLLFGWNRVSPKVHFFSAIMVFLGSMFSAVWIVVANSWMHTPAGFHIVDSAWGPRAEIVDFWAMVFNPSSMVRLSHVLFGCFIQGAFLIMSISAFYILRNKHLEFARRSFTIALVFSCVSILAQIATGHLSAEVVAEHQPAKLAAFEGVYKTEESTPLYLFGLPDSETEEVKFGVAVPGMLSLLVHHDTKTPVTGLDQFPEEDRPPVQLPFQMYHIMISLGMYFLVLCFGALVLMWSGALFKQKWLMWIFVFSVIAPFIANQAGWIAAEVGRQPWIVYGLLRTSDAVSKAVEANAVLTSLIMFTVIYFFLFAMFLYLLDRKIKHGPDVPHEDAVHKGKKDLIDVISLRKANAPMLESVGKQEQIEKE